MRLDKHWNGLPRPGIGISIPRDTQNSDGHDSEQPVLTGHILRRTSRGHFQPRLFCDYKEK